MATKAEFLKELFSDNPDLKLADANKAWKQSGNDGEISESSYYHTKQQLAQGKKGAKKGGDKKAGKTGSTVAPVAKNRPAASQNGTTAVANKVSSLSDDVNGPISETDIDEMEETIDDLLFRLSSFSGTEQVQETLRSARRQIIRLA